MVRTHPITKKVAKHKVGDKVYYLGLYGRKVTGVVESIDNVTHPSRINIRVTATKDRLYPRNTLLNTPPAFVLAR